MAYSANQYNYITPLSSAPGFVNETSAVTDYKFFSLANNTLDGTYTVASGDVGLWGTSVADANGNLSDPFVVTITESATIGAFRLQGSTYSYPVNFTVTFYNGSTVVRTISVTGNASAGYVYLMTPAITITSYKISITKISEANGIARVYNVYEPATGTHADALKAKLSEASYVSSKVDLKGVDTIKVKSTDASQPISCKVLSVDTAKIKETESDTIVANLSVLDTLKVKQSNTSSIKNTIDVTKDTVKIKQLNASSIKNTIAVTKDTLKVKVNGAQTEVTNIIDVTTDKLGVKLNEADAIVANIAAADTLKAKETDSTEVTNIIDVTTDTLVVKQENSDHITNIIDVTKDTLVQKVVEDITEVTNIIDVTTDTLDVKLEEEPETTNVHTRMKEPSRQIYGRVYITYTDPMLDNETHVTCSGMAYNSDVNQVMDGIDSITTKYFTLYDSILDGGSVLSDKYSQVGWVSDIVSGDDGTFATPPSVSLHFAERPITGLPIYFDTTHDNIVEDFTVTYTQKNGNVVTRSYTGNTEAKVVVTDEPVANVTSVTVTVTKVPKPGTPAVIVEIPIISTILYKGYKDASDLISIDLLEELTYLDDIEALGGVSANEITVVLDNSDKSFYFNNENSPVAQSLKRNRKIVPWLGVEIVEGEIEWYTLGTFWSYSWSVPVGDLTATVVGFDTIGLLGTTSFTNHVTLQNYSIGQLIEYVLADAMTMFDFIEYEIDPELYDVVIPYAWFENSSHAAALQRISECYPMHIYCDRNGKICAMPQKLHLDYYYDTWADNTNVISKTYDSLYTTLPNVVNITVNDPALKENESLVEDKLTFDIAEFPERTLNFSNPYMSDIVITMDKDDTVEYSYNIYSWGIEFTFTGSGQVRSIKCTGTVVDTENTSTITRKNEESIRLNGSSTRDIQSDFIQDSKLASIILDRLFSLSENDKYDATVEYRGDISLTINDPIRLLNGIAPDNRYNIKRHQLTWNGALTGSADLNT